MLKEDGLTNKEVADLHKNTENKYKTAVEKTLCRLLCKQVEDLDLLPKYLDRWKKFNKFRKIWRRILKDA